MAIEKYVTKCLVITSYDQGEHDRVYKIFTREFGLLMAHAKSVRKLESKLRAHIMPRTRTLVTLVQGKDVWRLVGAEQQLATHTSIREVVDLVSRFIHGEEAHTGLYDRLEAFLDNAATYDARKARILLYYIFLVELGYADVKVIGATTMKEYRAWSMNDLYTHLLLTEAHVLSHVRTISQDLQL